MIREDIKEKSGLSQRGEIYARGEAREAASARHHRSARPRRRHCPRTGASPTRPCTPGSTCRLGGARAGDEKEPGFLEKNNDSLAKEVEQHLLKSNKPIVVDICKPPEEPQPTGGKAKGGGKAQSSFASFATRTAASTSSSSSDSGTPHLPRS